MVTTCVCNSEWFLSSVCAGPCMFPRGCSCAGQILNSLLLLQYRCWIEIRCAVIHVFCSLYPMLICLIMLSFPRQHRKCFFTCENSHQLKQDFMKCVNRSMKAGGFLTCSFRDNEFGDFLLHKKRLCSASHLKLKRQCHTAVCSSMRAVRLCLSPFGFLDPLSSLTREAN